MPAKNIKMIFQKMNNKNLLLVVLASLMMSCVSTTDDQAKEPVADQSLESGFVHAVYFYLSDSMDQQMKDDFMLVLDTLATIPSLKNVYYGPPANTPRKVVDNSYDYAFICVFDSKEGHDAYQVHPVHEAFRQRYSPLIADVKIYDNVFGEASGYE